MGLKDDAFIEYAIRNDASRQKIRWIMLEHNRDTARSEDPPQLRHEGRTLSWIYVVHNTNSHHSIERMVSKRKPIAIIRLIDNARIALGGTFNTFG